MSPTLPPASAVVSDPPHIVAVGFRRINKLLQELAPDFAARASVEVLDMGFEQAVSRIRAIQADRPIGTRRIDFSMRDRRLSSVSLNEVGTLRA